jgi:hypothetical protein
METSSSHIEIKLPSASPAASNIPSSGLTGAVAPIQMGGDIKLFSSFDFMFSENQRESSSAS